MNSKTRELLAIAFILIIGIYFLISGLVKAQHFLAPIAVAGLLAMIFVPMSQRIESVGIGRAWSALISVLVALGFFIGLFFLVSVQVKRIANDWPQIQERIQPRIEHMQEWIAENAGVQPFEQERLIKEQIPGDQGEGESQSGSTSAEPAGSGSSNSSAKQSFLKTAGSMAMGFFSFLGTALLTGVYLFFMLLYRAKLKKSLLRFFSEDKKPQAEKVLKNSVELSQGYLIGRFWLIIVLAVLYSIGLSFSGVKHAILISILAALLSLVPYIGNVVGFILAIAMAAFSGVGFAGYVGVAGTFAIAQFVESYMLEPYVVGRKVDLNPLATILVVVLGGAIWGIIGMIIFIPLFGIVKIACDNIPLLKPIGYSLGEEDIRSSNHENFLKRHARRLVRKIKGS